ncbi:DNA internalization-related competence protein ComEC/Rec2 [Litorilinea aerophila]|nr:DNA internalization-related competence protein ComEC/Rec2 [Litorilinea aerophila]MCC9077267.1 DNA internalization-related competence protein ComEC/Rec2 [Litorilinea aerophila]
MTLLYLALAYMAGIVLGRLAWEFGWPGCGRLPALWPLPLLLLPWTPLLNRLAWLRPPATGPIRWPASAGFEPPRRGPAVALWVALALCLVAGLLRYGSRPYTPCWTPQDLAYYNLPPNRAMDRSAPTVTLVGHVIGYPQVTDGRQEIRLAVHALIQQGREISVAGRVRFVTAAHPRYQYGQPLRVQGRLATPPDFEDFSYREYLARQGVHSLLYSPRVQSLPGPRQGQPWMRVLYAFRARGEALINRLLPEPYAALANGMLLGIEAGIPDELYDQFNLTGTSHVIVISGSNVALVAGLLMALGTRLLGRRGALVPTLAGIAGFALVVGGDAAVLRAALMGGLYVIAVTLGRRSTALVSLAAACWAMTLANPLALWDVGFQLSSAATAGLILFTPGITRLFSRLGPGFAGGPLAATAPPDWAARGKSLMRGLVEDGLLVTLAANITTLPLVVFYFGRLSLVSLVTNLLIAPAQPLIMLWGSAALLVGVLGLAWLAQALLWIPWLGLAWTVAMVRWTAAWPGASLSVAEYGPAALWATYAAIAAVRWGGRWRPLAGRVGAWLRAQGHRRLTQPATAGALAVVLVLTWWGALTQPDGRLHLYFLDVGQGDGILIQTPSGRQVLVDGGSSGQQLFSQLGAVMPFWDRELDLVVLTHPDSDHMDGQAELPLRFHVGQAMATEATRISPDAALWRANLAAQGVTLTTVHAGAWLDLGDGVALWVLWPPDPASGVDGLEESDNERSLVLKLVYGNFSALLTGDAGLPSEERLMAQGAPLAATVLKVGHHGSKSSTGPDFVAAVNPAVAVIQVGADNDYGHPAPDVLAHLQGRLVLRNDLHGTIHLATDGERLWIEPMPADAPEP